MAVRERVLRTNDSIADTVDGLGSAQDLIDAVADADVRPQRPTVAAPGSKEKVLTLAARYAAGIPLWHANDCYEHDRREVRDEADNPLAEARTN